MDSRRHSRIVRTVPAGFLLRVGSPIIPVVCAVLEDEAGRILIAQRPADKHLGLKWEFAGGKVEPGESPETALVREIKEELGCDIVLTAALPRFIHDYGSVAIEMIPFAGQIARGSPAPHPREHVALRWIAPAMARDTDLAPADLPVLASYIVHHAGPLAEPLS
jgi:8-oxo-dGTP diphosphatase